MPNKADGLNTIWKIIVFDDFVKDLLSTLFKVGFLREQNITLNL